MDFEKVWERIQRAAGQTFTTKTGMAFTYEVPGDYLRVTRDGRHVKRSLSKTNFRKAALQMPTNGPAQISDRQGSSYTWAILMDRRVRVTDW